jgi:hypothetical protein
MRAAPAAGKRLLLNRRMTRLRRDRLFTPQPADKPQHIDKNCHLRIATFSLRSIPATLARKLREPKPRLRLLAAGACTAKETASQTAGLMRFVVEGILL